MDCVFCRIIAREEWAAIVSEDSDHVAFMDRYPIEIGHTLVAPKRHYETIFEMDASEVASLYAFATRIAFAIREALGPDGLNVVQNNGAAAGQVIFHVHVHLVPRRFVGNAARRHVFETNRLRMGKDELLDVARKISEALKVSRIQTHQDQ